MLLSQIGSHLGYAYALAGRLGEAIPLMEQADEQSKVIGRKASWALRITWRGHVNLLDGRIRASREQGQHALALATDGGERGNQAWAHKLLGDVMLQDESSDPSEALSHFVPSMALATELRMRPLQAHIHLSVGRLHQRENQIEQARAEFTLAIQGYRCMEMTTWRAAAERELSALVH